MKKIIYILCAVFMLNFSISAQEKTEEELIEAINNRKSPEWFDNAK